MPDLTHYSVGELYSQDRRSWPEGSQFNHRRGATELLLFYGSPKTTEVESARAGRAEFGLVTDGDLLLLLYRFGPAGPWSDAPYSWHLVPQHDRTVPDLTRLTDPHLTLVVMLIDAGTGIIRVIRIISLSPAFSSALALAIRDQAARPWPGDTEYDRQLNALYQRYPNSRDLLRIARTRCVGGQD